MPEKTVSYKSTTIACYIGIVIQAIVINLTPILFIPLREQFGLSFQQLGLLVFVNFVTQVSFDILFSKLVEIYGFRRFVVGAHVLIVVGLLLFALSPEVLAQPYVGFIVATIIFSGGGGLLELMLSPIVNAIPTDEKATAMSLLHSFYAWGQAAVILLTTLLLFVLGRTQFQWIILLWTIVPAFNFFLFIKVPLGAPIVEGQRTSLRKLLRTSFYIVALLAIGFGAAAEICMAQWTSAFFEKALHLPKIVGDAAGVSMFALALGLGRLLYGILGKRMDINQVMIFGSFLSVLCYLAVGLSNSPFVSLTACMLCGLAVSLLWPGTLVLTAEHFPLAGASMFAILAAGGDFGAAVGPWLISLVADYAPQLPALASYGATTGLSVDQLGLRLGLLTAALFPLGSFLALRWMRAQSRATVAVEQEGIVSG